GPRYSASVPVYEGYVATMQALNRLPTLQERVGQRYFNTGHAGSAMQGGNGEGGVSNQAVWGRIEGAHNRLEPDTTAGSLHQDINTFILQAGVDGQFYEDANGRLIAGITGQYGRAHSNVSNFYGDGSIDTQGWGLGATATWYGNNGFYIDGQGQANWYDSDLGSDDLNTGLADGRKGFGYALSIEAGQRIGVDENWSLTPQAQLMWSSVDFDAFTDTFGTSVDSRDGNSLQARLGLAANYANSWKGNDGLMVNTSVYGIANLYQELVSDARINIAGVNFDTDNDRTWAGIGAGGTYSWADNKYSVYGEGSINTSLNHFADSYALKGTVGFKVKW
uniref:autotransporter family protein n=1 Tax=Brucella anthropi TaxID=529 RepID=UPI00235F1F96